MKKRQALMMTVLLGLIAAGGATMTADVVLPLEESGAVPEIQTESEALSGETSGEMTAQLLGNAVEPVEALRVSRNLVETYVQVTFDASEFAVQSPSSALYAWDLDGDGEHETFSSAPILIHAYQEDGVYPVRVRITDDVASDVLSSIIEVTVLNRRPTALSAILSESATNAEPLSFSDWSQDLDGAIASWSWAFGDGATSNESNPSHTYESAGEYRVRLVVIDDDGASSEEFIQVVTVENVRPNASFTALSSATVGVLLAFADESVDPSVSGRIVHVAWDFGDGSYLSGGPSRDGLYTHVYAAPGDYTVTLFVIDQDGGLSSIQRAISVIDTI